MTCLGACEKNGIFRIVYGFCRIPGASLYQEISPLHPAGRRARRVFLKYSVRQSEIKCERESNMDKVKRILISGFEPFGGLDRNNSEDTVLLIPDEIGSIAVEKVILPVEYGRCADILIERAELTRPDAVICTGVAQKRSSLCFEYAAINIMDSASADNAGKVMSGVVIEEEGDSVLYTSLPLERMLGATSAAGVPSSVSFDAGTYVCNNLFYKLMYEIKYSDLCRFGGFIHFPRASVCSPERLAGAVCAAVSDAFS